MKEVKLYNRYRDPVSLIPIHRNEYILKCPDLYLRVGLTDIQDEFTFVDPSGGPFLEIGKELQLHKRKMKIVSIFRIDNDIHIIFEKV